jgi:ADP-heptose:LPS heptosyltransferase
MKQLDRITLIIADTKNYGESVSSLKKSLKLIKPAKTKFLTDVKIQSSNLPFEIIPIDKIKSKREYSNFIIKKLDNYFDTDFVLVTQHDSWVIDENAWDDEYLNYDYIGASWVYDSDRQVGNGGFSIRSKKLQHILATDNFIDVLHPEDQSICIIYKFYLEEKYGIKFAPESLADKFSYELREPIQSTFGFHGKFYDPYKPTIVLKRSAAMGDIVMLEPVMEYFFRKGYNVALDIPTMWWELFLPLPYPMKHISQLDPRVPRTTIDFDLSYENNPKQLHLKSYFETAGITDYKLRNPSLNFPATAANKMFKKYIVLHIDRRDQEYRNINTIFWDEIVVSLKQKGYDVIQIGLSVHEEVKSALQMKTASPNFLLYLIAGADGFIGIDSAPSNIAIASKVKSVIFFGSVNPDYIIPDKSNVLIIHKHDDKGVCEKPFCWSETVGCTGTKCYIDNDAPPCTQFDNIEVLEKINNYFQ